MPETSSRMSFEAFESQFTGKIGSIHPALERLVLQEAIKRYGVSGKTYEIEGINDPEMSRHGALILRDPLLLVDIMGDYPDLGSVLQGLGSITEISVITALRKGYSPSHTITFRSVGISYYFSDCRDYNSSIPRDAKRERIYIGAADQIEPFIRGLIENDKIREALFTLRLSRKNFPLEFTLMSPPEVSMI